MSGKQLWRVLALVSLLILIVACGGGESADPTATSAPVAEPTDAPPTEETAADPVEESTAEDAFPLTIEHAFGEMTLETAPERIVSIGYADQDILFALGTNPVAVRYWFGPEDTGGIFPWAADAFTGDELPELLNLTFGELNYETLVGLNPDLIVAVSSGITEDEYGQLAQIAPTLAQSGDYNNFGMPWDEAALMIGEAVGKSAEAAAIVADVNAQFEAAIAAHPEFVDKNLVVATGGRYAVFSTQDARPRFFQSLGFAPQSDLDELTGANFYTELSEERVDLLDRDIVVFTQASYLPDGADSITNDPLLSQLDVIQDERYIILSDEIDGAFSFSSVLSLPYAIDQLVPQLADALGSEMAEEGMGSAETRLFTDAMDREVAIPVDPQRIVVLSEIDLDSLLALGITPVGAPNGRGQSDLPSYLTDEIAGQTTALGGLGEPNLELVAELNPDLIVYSDPYGALMEMIPEMEQIAPVVVPYVYTDSWDWKVVFAAIAASLDMTAEADAVLADYNAKAAELGAQLPDDLRPVSIVRWMADGPRILLTNAFSSLVLTDIGFERPEYQLNLAGAHPVHTDVINMEQIQVVDAPIVFAGGLNPEGDAVLQDALENPLVQTFESVQNDRFFVVDGLAWSSTGGPLAALEVLADVEAALGDMGGMGDSAEIPQRIIAMDEGTMVDLLALGVTPVGVQDWGRRDFSLFLNYDADAVASVGSPEGPNLEAMLTLEPDLIIGRAEHFTFLPEGTQESLEAIAPLIISESSSVEWEDHLTFIAEHVGKEAEAAALIDNYDTRIAEFRDAWAATGSDETIAIIRSRADSFNVYANGSFIAETVTEAGLTMPASFADIPQRNSISVEEIDILESDYLFVMARNEDEGQAFLDSSESPLWQFLPAVQNDKIYQVNWSVWVAGWNSVGAQLVLDDLFYFMLNDSAPTPNPVAGMVIDEFSPQYDVERFGLEPATNVGP